MFKRATWLAAVVTTIAAAGCSGSDGAQGPQGATGATGGAGTNGTDYTAVLKPEACAGCHDSSGMYHQLHYNKYTDASTLAANFEDVQTVGTTVGVRFAVTKSGNPYVDKNLTFIDQKTFYTVFYNPGTREFLGPQSYSSPVAYADGHYVATTSSSTLISYDPNAISSAVLVYGYLAQGYLGAESSYTLYDDVVNFASTLNAPIDYVSAANVSGCEKCHGAPYRKHGYRMAKVDGVPDFAACKTCHYDNRKGGHQAWQLLADDPVAYANQGGVTTDAQNTQYAYVASVMNDVHMSHAMEFEFPQSMANCVTCHAGKLDTIFADSKMRMATCKSCHPIKGPEGRGQKKYIQEGRAPALEPLMASTLMAAASSHASFMSSIYSTTADCSSCHKTGGTAPTFASFHNGGYDSQTYTTDLNGTKYSDAFTVSFDAASISTYALKVSFHVTKAGTTDPAALGSITPTIIVGLYGWDSKDFYVDAHGRDSGAGLDPSNTTTATVYNRTLEWVYGKSHSRFNALKVLPRGDGQFQFTVDLNTWKSLFATTSAPKNILRRLEVAVLPTLKSPDGTQVYAIKSVTKTFDLIHKAWDTSPFATAKIVDEDKCIKCHDQLGAPYHAPDRGNVRTCRLCHNTKSGGAHLEMQSRSIDSYIHAIHNFQAFDIGAVDFADTVARTWYQLKTESTYPLFTVMACESCHTPNSYYNPPGQGDSLPGLHSASATLTNGTRAIGGVPATVQGPAARACGSCHRAQAIKEDNAGALTITNEHFKANGYFLDSATNTLSDVWTKIMSIFGG